MAAPTLTSQQLNRATLARQMLLAREKTSTLAAVEKLGGLQAQLARPPYIGLWSRLEGFRREQLTEAVTRRELVRGTLMRGTIHLCAAQDYLVVRPLLQPMLTKAVRSVLRARAEGLEIEGLLAAARAYLLASPRRFEEIRAHLESLKLPGEERARGFAVRMHLPLVQVPDGSAWGYPGNAAFALADDWLDKAPVGKAPVGRPRDDAGSPPDNTALVTWYLRAFGPASVADAQIWSGVTPLKDAFERLRPNLVTFRDERGKELFDLPDAPRPEADIPAPVRFLPEYDSLILAHDDRRRVIDDAHRKIVFKPGGLIILPTFLVEGRVAGTWDVETRKKTATLSLTPFGKLTKKALAELATEGEKLVRFIEPACADHDVRVVTPAKAG